MRRCSNRRCPPAAVLVLALVLLLASLPCSLVRADAPSYSDGYFYVISGNEVTITGYDGPPGSIVVPGQFEDFPVRVIGSGAFGFESGITYIVLPPGVRTIATSAFSTCTMLLEVQAQEGLEVIEQFAFTDCSVLYRIVLPESLERIGESAFVNCKKLSMVDIPAGVSYIGDHAFDNTNWLAGLTDTLEIVGDGQLMKYNGSSSTVIVPDGVRRIYNNAFAMKSSLTRVFLPDGMEWIGKFAFYGCPNLESIRIPYSVSGISSQAFFNSSVQECPKLVIRGFSGSYASSFATAKSIPFVPIATVRFMSLGGSAVPNQDVDLGNLVTKPANPVLAGLSFEGWYPQASFLEPWDFLSDRPTETMTLFARWSLPQTTGLKAQRIAGDIARLTWNPLPGATGYELYRSTESGGPYMLVSQETSTSRDFPMTGEPDLYFRVVAFYRAPSPYDAIVFTGPASTSVKVSAGPATSISPGATPSTSPGASPQVSPVVSPGVSPGSDPTSTPTGAPDATATTEPAPTSTGPAGPNSGDASAPFPWWIPVLVLVLGGGGTGAFFVRRNRKG